MIQPHSLDWLDRDNHPKHTQVSLRNIKQAIKPLQGYFLALSANQLQAASSMLDGAWKSDQPRSINLKHVLANLGFSWCMGARLHSVLGGKKR